MTDTPAKNLIRDVLADTPGIPMAAIQRATRLGTVMLCASLMQLEDLGEVVSGPDPADGVIKYSLSGETRH